MPYFAPRWGWQIRPLFVSGLLWFCLQSFGVAADRVWTGGSDTNWSNNANWSGGAPLSSDNAKFNGVFSNQPNLTAPQTVGGLWMTTGVGQNVTISGSTLTLNGNTINGTSGLGILVDNSSAYTLTINAPLLLGGNQTWRNNSGNLLTIGSGGVNLNGLNLTIDGTGDTTVSGVISGNGTLAKNGTGTLTLSGANTYNAPTNINVGVVNVQNSSALGIVSGGVFVASGAALQLQGGISVGNQVSISGNGISSTGAIRNVSGTNTLTNNITLTADSTMEVDAGQLNVNGQIVGNFNLTINAVASTLSLGGATDNTSNGTTTLTSGTLLLAKTGGHHALTGPLVIGNGTGSALVQYTGGSNELQNVVVTLTSSGTLDLNNNSESQCAGLNFTGGAVTTGTGTLTLGGGGAAITSNASSSTATISGHLDLGGTDRTFTVATGTTPTGIDMNISAGISGNHNIIKAGTGLLEFSGTNTYSGMTTINAGTLQFGKEVSLYNDNTANWTAGNLIVASGATAAFNVGGSGEFTSSDIDIIKALGTGSGGFKNGSIIGFDTTNAVGGTFTYGSNIANTNGGANVLGVTKLGPNALVLTGTNTYTGPTTVNAGSLFVNGSTAFGSTISVYNSGSTIGGSGTINGSVNLVSAGTNLSPGASGNGSISILQTGPVTLGINTNFNVDINGPIAGTGYDQLKITGSVSINGSNLNVTTGTGLSLGQTFYIVLNDGSDAITGTFAQGSSVVSSNGYTFMINYMANGDGGGVANDISLTVTGLPEPANWIAGIFAVALLFCHIRVFKIAAAARESFAAKLGSRRSASQG
jgi:autotransporter-associated beta strand protein